MENLNKNSIFHANILFFILGILLITLGSIVQGREVYSGLLITEYIIVLIPNIIYLKSKGLSLKKTLRLHRISFKQALYVVGITISTYPIAVFLNLIIILVLEQFGDLVINTVPIPSTAPMYLLSLFVIAISPGICEEIMFRGTIMNAYNKLSKKKAIIYSSILFGVFHLNLQNLVGHILLGLVFGIIVYKTNSIYSSILGHTLNNAIAITIGYFALKAQESQMHMEAPIDEMSYKMGMVVSVLVIGIFAAISCFILIKLIKKLPKSQDTEIKTLEMDMGIESYVLPKFIEYLPVLGIVVLFIIINAKFLYL